jgi:penicillin-binding protein 1A
VDGRVPQGYPQGYQQGYQQPEAGSIMRPGTGGLY